MLQRMKGRDCETPKALRKAPKRALQKAVRSGQQKAPPMVASMERPWA